MSGAVLDNKPLTNSGFIILFSTFFLDLSCKNSAISLVDFGVVQNSSIFEFVFIKDNWFKSGVYFTIFKQIRYTCSKIFNKTEHSKYFNNLRVFRIIMGVLKGY